MLIKNIAKGGRGLGIEGHPPIEWAPGETKDVNPAVIAKAMKDPANAELLTEEGGLVEVSGNPNARPGSPALSNPSGTPEDIAKIEAAAQKAREDAEAQAKADADKQAADEKAKADAEGDTKKGAKK